MEVVILECIAKKDKCGTDYYWLIGRLQSGLEIIIEYFYDDLQKFIGKSVEMLLSILRSPYLELERGIHNQIFVTEEYYSIDLIDELVRQKKIKINLNDNRKRIILTGEYIDSYIVPEKWYVLIRPEAYRRLFREVSALKTRDGIYLLNPFHSEIKIPVKNLSHDITIATGSISLVAWHPVL